MDESEKEVRQTKHYFFRLHQHESKSELEPEPLISVELPYLVPKLRTGAVCELQNAAIGAAKLYLEVFLSQSQHSQRRSWRKMETAAFSLILACWHCLSLPLLLVYFQLV